MKILTRYVLREHAAPFAAALAVLTVLMLLNQLARRFDDLVGKGLPWHVIAEVFGLSVPFILAMTLPMAVLVAVLYSFARLSGDNEITAMRAGGVSLLRITLPVLVASTVIAGGMTWFNDNVLPESNHALRQLLSDIGRKRPTFELRERVVNEVVPGKFFLQAASIDRRRSVMRDLVIFDLGREDAQRTIYADSGHMAFNPAQTDLYLTLYDGSMHELDRADPSKDQRSYYSIQVIRVAGVTNELERGRGGGWRGDREMTIAMMREEIGRRHDALRQLNDSVSTLMGALVPGTADAEPSVGDGASERDIRGTTPIELPPQEARTLRRIEPTRGRHGPIAGGTDTAAARGDTALERIGAAVESIAPGPRPRAAAQRVGWPPSGDPVAYAGRVRSHFQQLASRAEMQRRDISRYAVEIQKKFSIPVAAIVFVLLGAPIGVRFPRGGIGMVIGVSLAVFCVYYVFLIGGEELADRMIVSPFWGMWAPNVLFGLFGLIAMVWVAREGGRLPGRRRRLRRSRRDGGRREPARARDPVVTAGS